MGLVLYMCELGWGKGDMQLWSRVIIGLLIVGDAEGFECVWKKFHYHLKKSIQNKIRIPPQKKKKEKIKILLRPTPHMEAIFARVSQEYGEISLITHWIKKSKILRLGPPHRS